LYKFNDQWTSQTVFSRSASRAKGIYTYIWDDEPGDNWFDQYFHNEQYSLNTTDIQQNFNGDFKLGKIRNRVLIGLDYFNRNVIDNGSGWGAGRSVTPQGEERPYGDNEAVVSLTKAGIDQLLANSGASNSNITNSSYSAYASDVINFTPWLMAMASLRADYFESKGEKGTKDDDFDQFVLSPKFGLIIQPIPNKVSVFANYMNAFVNVDPRETYDADMNPTGVKSFKPEHANQWEAGVKTALLDDRLNITVSYYDIKVTDRVVPIAGNPNDYRQGGKVGSKGFEFELSAHPVKGLSVIAGYSHNEIKVLEGTEDDFYNQPGRAPGGQGPQDLANLWANYKIIKNFGIGIGGNYAGEYKVIDNSKTGVFTLPSYTLVNGSIFYNSSKIRVSLNVNNINNAEYYIGYWSVNPQKPRNFVASFAYKF